MEQGLVNSKAELAQREGLTRARMTQILNLLKLPPEIQKYLKSINTEYQTRFFTEKKLRKIATIKDPKTQLKKFEELKTFEKGRVRFQG